MPKDIPLTLATGDYEIIRPILDGKVKPDGIELTHLTNMDSTTRHWRFLRNGHFDVAELSASSFLLAKDNGWPVEAIPVFLHRRFRHGFVFVNKNAGIREPKDLIGKKVGVKSYQVTAIVWIKGILESEYGVPLKSIDWYADLDEDVEFTPPEGLRLTTLPDDKSIEKMLVTGELDAVMHPEFIDPWVEGDPNVGRLFEDNKAEEIRYFEKTGIFPIMHVMAMRTPMVERHPWIPIELYKAFDNAKALGMKRMFNPRVAPIVWYSEAWEEQERILGPDPWQYGLTEANCKNMQALIDYSYDQGLIKKKIPLDELFLDVGQGRKRGTFRV
ncbi:MAG: hypothetical protein RLZ98_368 [Pseudomonadota bacterium]|jgi:4,5-dihydroxyphthalate decarboxylase